MATMKRRDFFTRTALTAGGVVAAGLPLGALGRQARTPAAPKSGYKIRPAGKVEFLFTCPGNSSNGLECSPEGIWTIDPAGSRGETPGRCKVYLSSYDGKLIRELSPEGTGPSGIASDGKTLWIASTYSREMIRVDANSGETISKHFTPGAGVIYRMTTDAEARPDMYAQKLRADAAAAAAGTGAEGGGGRGRGGRGRGGDGTGTPGPPAPGTGGHGVEVREGKVWVAVPPGRMIYRIDPATWRVEHMFPSVGNRPHGIGFQGNHLWESDTNLGGFFKRDLVTGEVVDAIQLADADPFPHGMSVKDDYIYWCDDVGNGKAPLCRVKI